MSLQTQTATPEMLLLKRLGALWAAISVACIAYALAHSESSTVHPVVEFAFLIFVVLAIPLAELVILKRTSRDYRAFVFPSGRPGITLPFMTAGWWLFLNKTTLALFLFGLVAAIWCCRAEKSFPFLASFGTGVNFFWVWKYANRIFRDENARHR